MFKCLCLIVFVFDSLFRRWFVIFVRLRLCACLFGSFVCFVCCMYVCLVACVCLHVDCVFMFLVDCLFVFRSLNFALLYFVV